MVRPKKSLGQHFLIKKDIAEKIVNSLKADCYKTVVEVGPGKGILTGELIKRDEMEVFPVEIDKEVSDFLLKLFPEVEKNLVIGDILQIDLSKFGKELGVIGNFPYYISSQILFHLLKYKKIVQEIVCMVQKEVAERIVSPPGNKRYGILSVLLQTWYDTEYLFTVGSGSFYPKPEVESGVIRLTRNAREAIACDEDFYLKVIKTVFNQRRKMLRNTVSYFINGEKPGDARYSRRPEELSPDEFIELAVELASFRQNTT